MLIGVLLVITWLILLLRYPAKALPVSWRRSSGWDWSLRGCSGRKAARPGNWSAWNCASPMPRTLPRRPTAVAEPEKYQ